MLIVEEENTQSKRDVEQEGRRNYSPLIFDLLAYRLTDGVGAFVTVLSCKLLYF